MMSPSAHRRLRFDSFELDIDGGELRQGNNQIHLSGKPFWFLTLLLEKAGEAVTREEIRERLWGGQTFGEFDDSLNHIAKKVRQALGDNADTPRFIETLPRRGYRFLMPVEVIGSAEVTTKEPSRRAPTIAVLPFVNLSPSSENEYFSDGLTDELIHCVASIPGLRVAGRTSSFQFKGKVDDLRRIGEQLKVDTLLEGTVRREGQHLLITVQLIGAVDGLHIWSGRYEREIQEIFAIQRDISNAIAQALRARLPLGSSQAWLRQTENIECYSLYLHANAWANQRTREGLLGGREMFHQALALQPDYAPALAGLAMTLILLSQYDIVGPESYRLARAAALDAIRIVPELGEARIALAWLKGWVDWDHKAAESEFARSIALSPGSSIAHQWYGEYMSVLGRHDDAIEELRRALDIDPISPVLNTITAFVLFLARRYEEALKQCTRALDLQSDFLIAHYFRSLVYHKLGLMERAIEELDRTRGLWGAGYPLERAVLEAAAKRPSEVLIGIENLRENAQPIHGYRWLNLALIYGALGEDDMAFASLEGAYQARTHALLYLNVDPRFDMLRSDPRFNAFLRRMQLTVTS